MHLELRGNRVDAFDCTVFFFRLPSTPLSRLCHIHKHRFTFCSVLSWSSWAFLTYAHVLIFRYLLHLGFWVFLFPYNIMGLALRRCCLGLALPLLGSLSGSFSCCLLGLPRPVVGSLLALCSPGIGS